MAWQKQCVDGNICGNINRMEASIQVAFILSFLSGSNYINADYIRKRDNNMLQNVSKLHYIHFSNCKCYFIIAVYFRLIVSKIL